MEEYNIQIDETVKDLLENPVVNRPPHYTSTKYEVIDVIEEWFPNDPHLFSAVQYLARWDKKGDPTENLKKAIWYIHRKLQKFDKRN